MTSIRRLLLILIFPFIIIYASAQDSFHGPVSRDTLVAGETNEMLIIVPIPDTNTYQIVARLIPVGSIDDQLCQDCWDDTLWAEQIHKVSDTLYSITFDVHLGAYPTRYNLDCWDESGWNFFWSYDHMFIISKPYIVNQPESITLCHGDQATLAVLAYEPDAILYQWFHNDVLLEWATERTQYLSEIQMADTGRYYCILSNQWGEDTTDIARIDIPPLPEEIGMPFGSNRSCQGAGNTSYYLLNTPEVSSWNWVLLPESAGLLDQQDTSVTVQWNRSFTGMARIFAETVLDQCPGPNSDTLNIQISGPSLMPEICIVGLEEEVGKYRIVWNKLPDESIVSYNIYRESNQAGVFLKLNTVPVGDFSVYVDSFSVPEEVAHSYRISYSDTCGLESEFSPIHSTIHLSANVGTSGQNNLIWSPYSGFAFLTYNILRGVDPDTLHPFQEVSSNMTSFSDLDPPGGNVYYQIVVSRDGLCQPAKKSGTDYSITKSNIIEFMVIGTGPNFNDGSLDIFPNPAREYVKISFTGYPYKEAFISVCNLTGKQITSYQLENNVITIPTNDLGDGIYLVRLETNRLSIVKKFIIMR